VKLFPGLDRLYLAMLRVVLRRLVRATVVPEQLDAPGIDLSLIHI